MSKANFSGFQRLDLARYGGGAQCFPGACSQSRIDATLATTWPGAAIFTAGPDTTYVAVLLGAPGVVYAGASGSPGDWEARGAAYPAGWWPIAVTAGDLVVARDLAS